MALDVAIPVEGDFVQDLLVLVAVLDNFVDIPESLVAVSSFVVGSLVVVDIPVELVLVVVVDIDMACAVNCLLGFESYLVPISLVVPEDSGMVVGLVDYNYLT